MRLWLAAWSPAWLAVGRPALAAAPGLEGAITLPPGFTISLTASGLAAPRFMGWRARGDLLLSPPKRGEVVALRESARAGRADRRWAVTEGLDRPHGLAFRSPHTLYVAETSRVLRTRYDVETGKASAPEAVVPNIPNGTDHWTRTIALGPDGALYISDDHAGRIYRIASGPR